jgi:hypothetical protein
MRGSSYRRLALTALLLPLALPPAAAQNAEQSDATRLPEGPVVQPALERFFGSAAAVLGPTGDDLRAQLNFAVHMPLLHYNGTVKKAPELDEPGAKELVLRLLELGEAGQVGSPAWAGALSGFYTTHVANYTLGPADMLGRRQGFPAIRRMALAQLVLAWQGRMGQQLPVQTEDAIKRVFRDVSPSGADFLAYLAVHLPACRPLECSPTLRTPPPPACDADGPSASPAPSCAGRSCSRRTAWPPYARASWSTFTSARRAARHGATQPVRRCARLGGAHLKSRAWTSEAPAPPLQRFDPCSWVMARAVCRTALGVPRAAWVPWSGTTLPGPPCRPARPLRLSPNARCAENNGCRAQIYDSAYICQISQFDDRVRWLNNSFHAERTGRGAR